MGLRSWLRDRHELARAPRITCPAEEFSGIELGSIEDEYADAVAAGQIELDSGKTYDLAELKAERIAAAQTLGRTLEGMGAEPEQREGPFRRAGMGLQPTAEEAELAAEQWVARERDVHRHVDVGQVASGGINLEVDRELDEPNAHAVDAGWSADLEQGRGHRRMGRE